MDVDPETLIGLGGGASGRGMCPGTGGKSTLNQRLRLDFLVLCVFFGALIPRPRHDASVSGVLGLHYPTGASDSSLGRGLLCLTTLIQEACF